MTAFNGLIVGMMAGLFLAIGQYRLLQWRKLHQLRTRIASDLHDEVGSNLVRIALLADAGKTGAIAGTAGERYTLTTSLRKRASAKCV